MDRLSQLEELLREDPTDPFLKYAIALEHGVAGNRSEAIVRLEALLKDEPDYLGAFYQLGQYYEQENQPEKAMDIYRRGMEVANRQKNKKTFGELRSALDLLED